MKYLFLLALIACGNHAPDVGSPVSSAPVVVAPVPVPVEISQTSLFSGPIKSFQIMHIKDAKDLKKRLRKVDVVTLELDEITKEISDIIHANGSKLIAYFSGGWEKWREDAGQFPKDAIGDDICNKMRGKSRCWPGERWGNLTKPSLQNFLAGRMDKAKELGADGIEVDNTDIAFNDVGFEVTKSSNISALIKLAKTANDKGLFIVAKNGPEMAKEVAPYYQGSFIEECNDNHECNDYTPFKGKIVAMKEYSDHCFVSNWSTCQAGGDYFED